MYFGAFGQETLPWKCLNMIWMLNDESVNLMGKEIGNYLKYDKCYWSLFMWTHKQLYIVKLQQSFTPEEMTVNVQDFSSIHPLFLLIRDCRGNRTRGETQTYIPLPRNMPKHLLLDQKTSTGRQPGGERWRTFGQVSIAAGYVKKPWLSRQKKKNPHNTCNFIIFLFQTWHFKQTHF